MIDHLAVLLDLGRIGRYNLTEYFDLRRRIFEGDGWNLYRWKFGGLPPPTHGFESKLATACAACPKFATATL